MKRFFYLSVFFLSMLCALCVQAQEVAPENAPADGTEQNSENKPAEAPKDKTPAATNQELEAQDLLQKVANREKVKDAERLSTANAHFDQGKRLFDKGMYENSIQYFQKALAVFPDHKGAKEYLDKAEANAGTRVSKVAVETKVLKETDSVRKSERLAEIRNRMEKAKAYQEESEILGKQQRSDLAREEKLDQMIKLLNQALEEYRKTLEMLQWVDVSEESLKEITATVKKEMKDIDIAKMNILKSLDDVKKSNAIQYAKDQAALDSDLESKRLDALSVNAREAFDRGNYQQCEKICRQILKIDPNNKDAIRLRAKSRSKMQAKNKVYIDQNYEEESKRWLEKNTLDMIPWNDYITYSEDWDWISQRTAIKNVKHRETAWQARYRGILDQKASFEWSQVPLADVIQDIRNLFPELQIILQKSALDKAGITDQELIDWYPKDLPLKSILKVLLAQFNLTYGLVDQALVISNEAGVQGELSMVRYDVRDLTVTINDFQGPDVSLANATGIGEDAGITMPADTNAEPVTATQIKELIESKLNKSSWDSDRGTSITEKEGQLLITQTYEMHLMIEDFLTRLRRTRATQVAVNTRFINSLIDELESIGVNWQGLDQADLSDAGHNGTGAGFLTDVRDLDRYDGRMGVFTGTPTSVLGKKSISSAEGLFGQFSVLGNTQYEAVLSALESNSKINTLNAPRILVYNNQLAFIAIVEQQSYVADYNVSDGIFDPQVASFYTGIVLEVRPTISSNRKYITLQLSPTIRNLADTGFETGSIITAVNAGFDLVTSTPIVRTTAVQTTVAIPDRGVMVIGGLADVKKVKETSGVPILSKIPLLGRLFRRDAQRMTRDNVLILVNAEIILLEEVEGNL